MGNTSTGLAAKRITALLDENTFVEIGALVTARATDFQLKQSTSPSDGVITGYGLIDENLVYVYSQDSAVLNGTIGEMHAKKIANLYDLALKVGAPVIGLIDSAGVRIQESTDALNAFGEIYRKQSLASGVIPQITAVFGNCGGGLAIFSALTDFTFIEGKNGKLFVNAPNTLIGNTEGKNDTSGAKFQSEQSGLGDVVNGEEGLIAQIRELITLLPGNNADDFKFEDTGDDINRNSETIADSIADSAMVLSEIADDNLFFEIKENYAKDMVTGFIRLGGVTVGAVANRSKIYDENGKESANFGETISAKGAGKAADFINFCDAFDIPVLSLTNVAGYEPSVENEKEIAQAAGKLAYAFANATVPKVNVITGKAYGSAYVIMNSKALGADITFAWEGAKVGALDASIAARILFDGQGTDVIAAQTKVYDELQLSGAAARGYVDTVINPEETRKYVSGAIDMLLAKRESRPTKKHGAVNA